MYHYYIFATKVKESLPPVIIFSDCFQKEIEKYYQQWRQKAIRLTRDTDTGQDLLQTTLERIATSETARARIDQMCGTGAVFIYVDRSVYRNWKSSFNKPGPHYVAMTSAVENVVYIDTINEQEVDVESFLHVLDDFDAELLRMSVMPGFDYNELADTLDVSVKKLYDSVELSKKKIRELIPSPTSNTEAEA